MISYTPHQDVTESDADLLVNTVNTVGVMGKGVALAFKKRFPSIMKKYQDACANGRLMPGKFQILPIGDHQKVINLATKEHWRDPSQYAWVGSGLLFLNRFLMENEGRYSSLCMPMPGAGNGGLKADRVQQMIRTYMAPALSHGLELSVCASELQPIADPIFYAGIGARKTPGDIQAVMREVGSLMSEKNINLRSGGAVSADSAFYFGAKDAHASGMEIYLPYPKKDIPEGILSSDITFDRLAVSFHPKPSSLTPDPKNPKDKRHATLKLMSRNGHQVFGKDFQNPSNLVICWTPEGKGQGGTGQAIRLAKSAGIPILDLGDHKLSGASARDIVDLGLEAIDAYRKERNLPRSEASPTCEM